MKKTLGFKLKEARNLACIPVKEISDYLISKGYKASQNTIYSWENDNSQPTPDQLLEMCIVYNISDPLAYFGYAKEGKPSAEAESEENWERQLLIDNFDAMNIAGQEELLKHSKLLLNDPQYRACAQFDPGEETA